MTGCDRQFRSLIAGLLATTTVLTSGTQAAAEGAFSPQDSQYLSSLTQILKNTPGSDYAAGISDSQKVLLARNNCAALSHGKTAVDLMKLFHYSAMQTQSSEAEALSAFSFALGTLVAGIKVYCPQYESQLK